MSTSPLSDDAKLNARKNILQALGGGTLSPETTPPSPPPRGDLSPDDVAHDNKLRVMNAVRSLQAEMKRESPIPPVAKPRKSPHSSPTNSRVSSPSRQKPLPPRPPPPKLTPGQSLHITPRVERPVTPPVSPMRRRSVDFLRQEKPKPPRRRKKFQTPEDAAEVDNPSNGKSLTDGIPESEDTGYTEPEREGITNDTQTEGEDSTNHNTEKQSADHEEAWEVIPDISVSNETTHEPVKQDGQDSPRPASRESNRLPKQFSQDSPKPASRESNRLPKQFSLDSQNGDRLSNETFEEAVRALSVKKKKKPPPLPAPYNERTPPLPTKKRRTVQIKEYKSGGWNQIAEEASSAAADRAVVLEADEIHGEIEQGEEVTEHVYEVIDPRDLRSRPENLVSPMLKNPSINSLDSEEGSTPGNVSRESALNRANTMGAVERIIMRGKNSARTRPVSTTSTNSSKDLEASFEVIPNRGSNIEDVMSTLRQADEKYQDATIYELIQACSRAMPHVTSTTELPPRIPDFPADGQRNQVIHELYSTEYTYVKGLEVLVDVFRDGLATVLADETSHVFANVDNILAFNKGFIALLHSRLRKWTSDSCVGDIFLGMFTQSHKSMYAIYCSNYDTAEMLVVNKLKKRKEFEQQLQTCFASGRIMPGLTLQAYLITPVQRIPRYILLLKDIIKRTPEAHPDFKNLTKALEIMNELAHYIDAQVSESQTKKTLESLKYKVHGLADLDSPDRSLVKDGQVFFKNIKKLYQCILFNDLLVLAHGDSKQSRVELQLNLEAVWIEDLEDLDPHTSNEDAIEVHTPERPYTLYTRSRNEKRLWLTKLRETIYLHLLQQGKCVPSGEFDADARHASFIYANERVYSGNYVGAKCHGKGTMTWPNKTVYVGDWVDDERCGEGEFTYNTGDVYRGRWSEDKQNGMGELQFASNDIYRGYWKDGIRHGDGKILYANGDVFDGAFVNGQIEGEGKLKCVNGVEFSGQWKHSQRHGVGRLRMATGKVYKGDFQYNLIHGQGTMTYPNRDKYDGRWKNGMRHGQGKLTSKLEGTYDGTWEEDLRHGFGKLRYPNKDLYEGQWEHNRRHGKGKMVYSDGRSYDGEFCNDMIHGEGLMNYSKDSKFQGSWVNGLRHGSGAMVFEDKSSYNGDWHSGLRHGHGEYVTADGSVYRGQWINDKAHGKGTISIPVISYSYNGDWISGKREGRGEEHSQYGQYKGAWKADMKHGYGEERTLVGTIFEGTWEKSRKHGRGVRKMIFGTVEEQAWKTGQLFSDPSRMTAVELPFLNRSDL